MGLSPAALLFFDALSEKPRVLTVIAGDAACSLIRFGLVSENARQLGLAETVR